ncbi:helix-turn-helix domain-containing protein [Alicyclobacillus sp. SP_1]|uniref:helix-turn-helix domain-containing protein n=1 Tax=Alicyclobacillus sp. SP_1 TaxID=2942475 RepID=UPI002157E6F8|nr:helix-turn-helix transcriptional regulator [Alicyclobacillus sp. SP_1]
MSRTGEDNLDLFSRRLSELLFQQEEQKKEIAHKLDITYRQLHRYESGQSKPDYDRLLKLADYLDVSIDYLVGRSDEPNITTPRQRD